MMSSAARRSSVKLSRSASVASTRVRPGASASSPLRPLPSTIRPIATVSSIPGIGSPSGSQKASVSFASSAHTVPTVLSPSAPAPPHSVFSALDTFPRRHVGPSSSDIEQMLGQLGYKTLDEFVDDVIPGSIRIKGDEFAGAEGVNDRTIRPLSESELLRRAEELGQANKRFRNFIGMGYAGSIIPSVILRNITENPAWYTQYTPYQPEISQGRLESLVNYQTMVTSLTGLDISNASLLDEGTAAAEAMVMSFGHLKTKKKTYLVDRGIYPQTQAVLRARAAPFGIKIKVGNVRQILSDGPEGNTDVQDDLIGVLVQYPDLDGEVRDWQSVTEKVHQLGGLVTVATDLLALTMLKPPGEWGADMALGNSARFGVPLGYGGPHAAFFSCTDALKRRMPGRLIGLSKDANGQPAYRLALQTREQHIRREKATSNICTAQALLANMAAMYALYHGPEGLRHIAEKVHGMTRVVKQGLERMSHEVLNQSFFDTLSVRLTGVAAGVVHDEARRRGINLRSVDGTTVGITVDESTTREDIVDLLNVFASVGGGNRRNRVQPWTTTSVVALARLHKINPPPAPALERSTAVPEEYQSPSPAIPQSQVRTSPFLTHPIFSAHRSETDLLRYIHHLQSKDLSLTHAMMPLGSCTMKLNPTTSMVPFTWKEFSNLHPFAPVNQAKGYHEMMEELGQDLCKITGLPAVSLQPNSGAQGEYAGLSVIRAYHHSRGDEKRDVCLVPVSAHGTNPASAIMAGMKVIPVKTLSDGSLDLADLKEKAEKYKETLAAFMVTYPSTFGVFEAGVQEACQVIHDNGGQVYLDGANLNAQVGLTNPAQCGADVCHLNLHKTLAIPHGGGGPGMGPICAAEHLAPFLPGHPVISTGGSRAIDAISAAPFGSASILSISWAFIKMLGGSGLTHSTKLALLNANYVASRLKDYYNIKFKNDKGLCAHEFLIDLAEFEKSADLKVMDFAKRLQDFSLHPPTCSWPISTAMLIEPTESESLKELDRFVDAMISIRKEADDIAEGRQPRDNNIIKNAPHPISILTHENWDRPYTREQAVYPDRRLRSNKFWPTVSRIDDAYGDRNLVCECPSVEEVADESL